MSKKPAYYVRVKITEREILAILPKEPGFDCEIVYHEHEFYKCYKSYCSISGEFVWIRERVPLPTYP